MKTIKTILSCDFNRYAAVSLVISGSMLLMPLPILFPPNTAGFPLAGISVMAALWVSLGVPLLYLNAAMDLGQSASPRLFRQFIHTLPIERWRIALAKLIYAFFWLVLLPNLISWAVVTVTNSRMGHDAWYDLKDSAPRVATIALVTTAMIVWVMLVSALLPRGFAYLSIPVFLMGEALARNATNFAAVGLLFKNFKVTLANFADIGLLSVEVALLSGMFVLFYAKRSRTVGLIGGFLALAFIDGLRALVAWLTSAHG